MSLANVPSQLCDYVRVTAWTEFPVKCKHARVAQGAEQANSLHEAKYLRMPEYVRKMRMRWRGECVDRRRGNHDEHLFAKRKLNKEREGLSVCVF